MSTRTPTSTQPRRPSAESRTGLLPGMSSPLPPPPRQAVQLGLAIPLGLPEDQLVLPGSEDAGTDPHRVLWSAGRR